MIKQGLKSVAQAAPNFSNAVIFAKIQAANIGFATKTKSLAYLVDSNATLTESQKTTIKNSLNVQPYINVGRYLQDLHDHSALMLAGLLGEPNLDEEGTGTFLEQLGMIDGIQGTFSQLYGEDASTDSKGVDDYIGSHRGILDTHLESVKIAITGITRSPPDSQDTQFQAATQALIDFVNALGDSTTLDMSTLNSLLSVYESAANNLDALLSTAIYSLQKTALTNSRAAIVAQMTLEKTNLSTVRTTSANLTRYMSFQGLAENAKIREVISKTATAASWQDYFSNYEERLSHLNAKYENAVDDSYNEVLITKEMEQRGLPEVKEFIDIKSVAAKASRDGRLSEVRFQGRSIAQIMEDCCEKLGIPVKGLDVYGQSQLLLENMNSNDREIIRTQLNLHQQTNTLS